VSLKFVYLAAGVGMAAFLRRGVTVDGNRRKTSCKNKKSVS
ncbi:hypothetical protein Tco_0512727, partial [Tanacetum coccineum]